MEFWILQCSLFMNLWWIPCLFCITIVDDCYCSQSGVLGPVSDKGKQGFTVTKKGSFQGMKGNVLDCAMMCLKNNQHSWNTFHFDDVTKICELGVVTETGTSNSNLVNSHINRSAGLKVVTNVLASKQNDQGQGQGEETRNPVSRDDRKTPDEPYGDTTPPAGTNGNSRRPHDTLTVTFQLTGGLPQWYARIPPPKASTSRMSGHTDTTTTSATNPRASSGRTQTSKGAGLYSSPITSPSTSYLNLSGVKSAATTATTTATTVANTAPKGTTRASQKESTTSIKVSAPSTEADIPGVKASTPSTQADTLGVKASTPSTQADTLGVKASTPSTQADIPKTPRGHTHYTQNTKKQENPKGQVKQAEAGNDKRAEQH